MEGPWGVDGQVGPPITVSDEDDKSKWLTRDLGVWVVGGYMLGTIALYGDNPHAYDRQHPSPAGGEPEVVFLATATASAAYTVIDTVERDTGPTVGRSVSGNSRFSTRAPLQ